MDPRTRMILFKMISRGVIAEVNGCISTGKEANVYHATTKDGLDRAVKVCSFTCIVVLTFITLTCFRNTSVVTVCLSYDLSLCIRSTRILMVDSEEEITACGNFI